MEMKSQNGAKYAESRVPRWQGFFRAVTLLTWGCLVGGSLASTPAWGEPSPRVTCAYRDSYDTTLPTHAEYLRMIMMQSGASFVRWFYNTVGQDSTVFFQNTQQYEYHFEFMRRCFPEYSHWRRMDDYTDLVFGRNDDPSTKGASAGAIYYAPNLTYPGIDGPGIMGYMVYLAADAQVRPLQPSDIAEIATVKARLEESVPFAAGRFVYVFPDPTRWIQFRAMLASAGVKSTHIGAFSGQGDRTVVYHAPVDRKYNPSYGYLRYLPPAQVERGEYTAKDILVLDVVPLDIGPTSGIITMLPQGPNSHVILRAANQNIPDAFIPNAKNIEGIRKYFGQLVEFSVTAAGDYTLTGADVIGAEELQRRANIYYAERVPPIGQPIADLTQTAYFPWDSTTPLNYANLVKAYGAKGTNFARLDQALTVAGYDRTEFRGAFLLPFSYYEKHMRQPLTEALCQKAERECAKDFERSLCTEAAQLCLTSTTRTVNGQPAPMSLQEFAMSGMESAHRDRLLGEGPYRKAYLSVVRELIAAADLDPEFLTAITAELGRRFEREQRIRFRSSTNMEDLPGMSGAGLYESKAGCLGDEGRTEPGSACMTADERRRTEVLIAKLEAFNRPEYQPIIDDLRDSLTKKKPVAKAIRGVFASLWREAAFLTRDYFHVDHGLVYMGILIHPSFADETANGVLIAEPTGQGTLAFDIHSQVDDIAVTNPELPWARTERVVANVTPGIPTTWDRRQLSNLTVNGANVLSDDDLAMLTAQVIVVHRRFADEGYAGPLDIEFKRDRGGAMLIKQARPYVSGQR